MQPKRHRVPPAVKAGLILAALVAIFLGKPLLHGAYYLPGDVGQIAGTRTLPAGQPVSLANGLESDPFTQMDPWLHYERQQVHSGQLPTWNPYNGLGVPQLANYQSAVLSPFNVPFYLLSFRWALLAAAFLKLWTLGFFAYLFFRRTSMSHVAALIGGIVYCFGGYHLLWLNWEHVGAAIVLPAGAWATLVVLQATSSRHRRLGLGAVALSVAGGALAGHPETLYYAVGTLAITVAYWLLTERTPIVERLRRAVALVGAAALGVAISAVQLLPFAEYLKISTEYATRTGQGVGGGLPSVALPLLAFPDVLGNQTTAYHEPAYLLGNYNEANGDYVGLIAMGLALLGVFALLRPGPRRRLAGIGLIISALGYALFHIPSVSTFTTKTPILKLATVNRSHDVWIFGVAVLAAVGADLAASRFSEGWSTVQRPRPERSAAILGVLVVSGVGFYVCARGFHELRALQMTVTGNLASTPAALHVTRRHAEWVVGSSIVAVLAVVILIWAPGFLRGRVRRPVSLALLGVVAIAQFGLTGGMLRNYNPSLPASQVYPLTADYAAAIAYTGNDTSIKDVSTFALPDSNLWWQTPQLTSYDALGVEWYDTLFSDVFHEQTSEFFDEGTPSCMANLRLFGVRYVWSRNLHPLYPGTTGNNTTNVVGPDVVGLKVVKHFGNLRIFQVPGSTGRFTVVHTTTTAASQADALNQVVPCGFNADASAVLLATGEGAVTGARAVAGSIRTVGGADAARQNVKVLVDTPEHQRLQVSNGAGGELVMRQTWFPGWQATVDGHNVPIDRVDVAMRGVALSAGSHVVDLTYRPGSVRHGILVSGVAALGAGALVFPRGWLFLPLSRRRRRASTGGGDASATEGFVGTDEGGSGAVTGEVR